MLTGARASLFNDVERERPETTGDDDDDGDRGDEGEEEEEGWRGLGKGGSPARGDAGGEAGMCQIGVALECYCAVQSVQQAVLCGLPTQLQRDQRGGEVC